MQNVFMNTTSLSTIVCLKNRELLQLLDCIF